MGAWWLPGSQQQRQAVVAELLVKALGAGGGGIHQAGVGGAPLPRDEPGAPRQQRLKLCRCTEEAVIAKATASPVDFPSLFLCLTSAVLGVALPQGRHGLDDVLVQTFEQRHGGRPLSPADRVAVRPRPHGFLQRSCGENQEGREMNKMGQCHSSIFKVDTQNTLKYVCITCLISSLVKLCRGRKSLMAGKISGCASDFCGCWF